VSHGRHRAPPSGRRRKSTPWPHRHAPSRESAREPLAPTAMKAAATACLRRTRGATAPGPTPRLLQTVVLASSSHLKLWGCGPAWVSLRGGSKQLAVHVSLVVGWESGANRRQDLLLLVGWRRRR
jgi:hypothetical protein